MASKKKLSVEHLMCSTDAINKAINMFGSKKALADAINDHRPQICSYSSGKRIIPITTAIKIEIATKGKIKRSMLRPDVF
jgi:DNA-binding transcriptional regulator YdaS (Cro superfamily)